MGSLVVLDYLLQRRQGLAGAIISGIAIEPVGVGSRATIAMARVLTHVLPRLSVNLGIDASALTRDPQALAAYAADPLVTGRATVRWGTESLDTVERIKEGMGGIDLPLLVIHGGADQLNCPEGAQALFDGGAQRRQDAAGLPRRLPRAAQRPRSRAGGGRRHGVARAPRAYGLRIPSQIILSTSRTASSLVSPLARSACSSRVTPPIPLSNSPRNRMFTCRISPASSAA